MAAGAVLGEDDLALIEPGLIRGDVRRPARRVPEAVRFRGLQEEEREVRRLLRGRLPEDGVLLGICNPDRRDRLPTHEWTEVAQPLLAVQSDVEEHAVQGSGDPDRVRAVLE